MAAEATQALRRELEALRAELALVREAHEDVRLHLGGRQDVPFLAQGGEWAALDSDSDEEENGCRSSKHAQYTFQARERRLTLGSEALERHLVLGDADVEVQQEGKEWAHEAGSDSDSDADAAAQGERSRTHAEETFRRREKRLTVGEQAIMLERPHGDKDVDLVPESSEWAHHDSDSSDSDGAAERFNQEKTRRRERRLTHGASMRDLGVTLGDAEVQVVAESAEWAGADEASDEEDDRRSFARSQSQAFERRERRLTLGQEELQAARLLGDVEVEVVAQETEWAGCEDAEDSQDEGDEAKRKIATDNFRTRERRLTLREGELQADKPLGDVEVPVVSHPAEWGALEDSSDDEGVSLERAQTERCQARERRLTLGAEALEKALALGDADVEVVAQANEWEDEQACVQEDADSDSDAGSDQADRLTRRRRLASESFEKRERRLTWTAQALGQLDLDPEEDAQ